MSARLRGQLLGYPCRSTRRARPASTPRRHASRPPRRWLESHNFSGGCPDGGASLPSTARTVTEKSLTSPRPTKSLAGPRLAKVAGWWRRRRRARVATSNSVRCARRPGPRHNNHLRTSHVRGQAHDTATHPPRALFRARAGAGHGRQRLPFSLGNGGADWAGRDRLLLRRVVDVPSASGQDWMVGRSSGGDRVESDARRQTGRRRDDGQSTPCGKENRPREKSQQTYGPRAPVPAGGTAVHERQAGGAVVRVQAESKQTADTKEFEAGHQVGMRRGRPCVAALPLGVLLPRPRRPPAAPALAREQSAGEVAEEGTVEAPCYLDARRPPPGARAAAMPQELQAPNQPPAGRPGWTATPRPAGPDRLLGTLLHAPLAPRSPHLGDRVSGRRLIVHRAAPRPSATHGLERATSHAAGEVDGQLVAEAP